MKTVIYFLTYKTESGTEGHRMAEWKGDHKADVESNFYEWCTEQKIIIEKEYSSPMCITGISLIK